MASPHQPLDEINLAVVGSSDFLVDDDELAEALLGCELVLSVGDVDLDRIARLMPSTAHCLYVFGDRDDPSQQPPPRCHLLNEKGARVFGWGLVGISGGSEFDEGDTVISEAEGERVVAVIEAIPDYDILVTHAPPPTAEADTGDGPPLLALETLYHVSPPLYHFYAHSTEGGDAGQSEGALLVGVCGLLRVLLRRPSFAS
jgi:hypothetical protein